MNDSETAAQLARLYVRCATFATLPQARSVFTELRAEAHRTPHHDFGVVSMMIGHGTPDNPGPLQPAVLIHQFEPGPPDFQRRLEAILFKDGSQVTPTPDLVLAYSIRRAKQLVSGDYQPDAKGMFDVEHLGLRKLIDAAGDEREPPATLLKTIEAALQAESQP